MVSTIIGSLLNISDFLYYVSGVAELVTVIMIVHYVCRIGVLYPKILNNMVLGYGVILSALFGIS